LDPEKATKATVLTWLLASLNGCRCDSENGLVAVGMFTEILPWRLNANTVSHASAVQWSFLLLQFEDVKPHLRNLVRVLPSARVEQL
jgi:hypothetical protein